MTWYFLIYPFLLLNHPPTHRPLFLGAILELRGQVGDFPESPQSLGRHPRGCRARRDCRPVQVLSERSSFMVVGGVGDGHGDGVGHGPGDGDGEGDGHGDGDGDRDDDAN